MATGPDQERVFAAIRLQGDALQELGKWSHAMQAHYAFRKWTYVDDLHITLQFYGDVDRTSLPQLHQVLQHAAEQTHPFTLELGTADHFGLSERPRVWWIALAGELEPLYELQRNIQQHAESLGYAADTRPYHPHITVARKYVGGQLFRAPDFTDMPAAKSWNVNEIVLYRTRLGQQPMYDPSAVFSFTRA